MVTFILLLKKAKKAKVFILNDWETRNEISEHRSLFFWIPRLDQLQDMIDWTKWECRIVKKINLSCTIEILLVNSIEYSYVAKPGNNSGLLLS